MIKKMVLAAAAFCAIGGAQSAQTFEVEQVYIFRGGSFADWLSLNPTNFILNEGFENNNPFLGPNFSNGNPATYTIHNLQNAGDVGNAVGESGGDLMLNPQYASITNNAAGTAAAHSLGLRLETNVSDLNRGLGRNTAFAVAALFPLMSPQPGYQYGIRLTDSYSNQSDIVDLRVADNGAGDFIYMRKQDFAAGTITDQSSTPLAAPNGAAYIGLGLTHETANSDAIKGYWGFVDINGNLVGGIKFFSDTADIFHGEDHTQFELRAISPVPEPETYAMLLSGLGALGWVARRRARHAC